MTENNIPEREWKELRGQVKAHLAWHGFSHISITGNNGSLRTSTDPQF